MVLTGKCKDSFEIWFRVKRANSIFRWWMLLSMDSTLVNALIIEFFDSAGIQLSVNPIQGGDFESFILINNFEMVNINDMFSNRKQAKEQAIKKANEIYNSK